MKNLSYILSCVILVLFTCLGENNAYAQSPQMKELIALFPNGILDAKGNKTSLSAMEGKILGVYFSAGWCGPCRRFSPYLVQFRDKFKEDFEVVLVGQDRNSAAQQQYIKKFNMKWLQVPFGSKSVHTLNQKFPGRGIPRLAILNKEGKLITMQGREMITQHLSLMKRSENNLELIEEKFKCGNCDKWHYRYNMTVK